jgi:hypothetical protein
MKHTLLAGIAAISLVAGTGSALAQSQTGQDPVASPRAQPQTQTRDQEGSPGTGMSSPSPQQPGTTGAAPSPPPAATGQAGQQPTTSPGAQPDTRDRDQEGTPGTGRSAPAPAGSPRQ